jgi:hypothetical protein
MDLEVIKPFIELIISALGGKYGIVLQIMAVAAPIIVAIKTLTKLIPGLVKIVVDATPSKEDDSLPAKIESSKIYATLLLVLDFLTSIKLKK